MLCECSDPRDTAVLSPYHNQDTYAKRLRYLHTLWRFDQGFVSHLSVMNDEILVNVVIWTRYDLRI